MASRRETSKRPKPNRDGGLALTFVNTTSAHRRPLENYADLLAWSRQNGALSTADTNRLSELAAEHPDEAEAVMAESADLHAILSSVFHAVADGVEPSPEAVEALNVSFAEDLPARQLGRSTQSFRWVWATPSGTDLRQPLWSVMWSAGILLTSPKDYAYLTRCAGEGCGALFVARNAGRPRKWCDMKKCGNRVKSRRHYHKTVKPRRAVY